MRRWFLVFLLVVLPAQFVWAAATRYCGHEAQVQAGQVPHFGHHEHEHEHQGSASATGAALEQGMSGDHDCGSCHFSCSSSVPAYFELPFVAAQPQTIGYTPPHNASRVPPGPERPQRYQRPFAARFGSGRLLHA